MTDKYQRFVDADTEINLDDNVITNNNVITLGNGSDEICDIIQRPQSGCDIGPVNTQSDDDTASSAVTYHKLDNNNIDDTTHTVVISDTNETSTDDRFQPLPGYGGVRQRLRHTLEHIAFRVVTVMLVILDVIVVIVDLSMNDKSKPMEIISIVIITYFVVECSLRLIAQGPSEFVKHWIEVLDAAIVLISFLFSILPIAMGHLNTNVAFIRLLVAGRLIRIILIVRLISEKRHLERATRQVVSQNKRRYQRDGFDLDLCYITERVIAMSFPSTGVMAFYRNPIKEVARFLDTKHKDHYMVINSCSERMYDESMFHNRVTRIRIDDHNVPTLQELLDFAKTARSWLDADPDNVLAVHCKGGKGRTGTIICTWLVESGTFDEAQDSLLFFGDRRTDLSVGNKFQGVETPSQSRYVGYFEKTKRLYMNKLPPEQILKLTSIHIKALSGIGCGDGRDLTCKVISSTKIWIYHFGKQENCETSHNLGSESTAVTLTDQPVLVDDIKVMFFCSDKSTPMGYDDCLLYFWFHTSFIEDGKLFLSREELDNPHKRKTWNVFTDEFSITLLFEKKSKMIL